MAVLEEHELEAVTPSQINGSVSPTDVIRSEEMAMGDGDDGAGKEPEEEISNGEEREAEQLLNGDTSTDNPPIPIATSNQGQFCSQQGRGCSQMGEGERTLQSQSSNLCGFWLSFKRPVIIIIALIAIFITGFLLYRAYFTY